MKSKDKQENIKFLTKYISKAMSPQSITIQRQGGGPLMYSVYLTDAAGNIVKSLNYAPLSETYSYVKGLADALDLLQRQ